MNFKKIITNTLAIVGAVVIIDKIVEVVTNKGTKAVCEALNADDVDTEDYDTDNIYGCSDSEEGVTSCECSQDCLYNEDESAFPDIKKYDEDGKHTFEYTINAENITSKPKEA